MENTNIILAGDMLPMPCNYDLFSSGDTQALFGKKLCDLFAAADLCVCNLEGCFTDSDNPIEKIGPCIKAPVSTVTAIKSLGINYATLGNTHSMDYGLQGYRDTCKVLDENGIGWFGWGENLSSVKSYVVVERNGRKIALYNTTEQFENAPRQNSPGVNLYDEYRVCRELQELKNQCDFLIVLYHGGIEGTHYNSEKMRRRFHRMADNGADVVISQHTHAVGEEEYYHHSYLLYGQGNFCFHFRPEVTPLLAEGIVLELIIRDDGFDAKSHRVVRTEKGCVYDDAQDLSDFYARSKAHDALLQGDRQAAAEFEEHFGADCANWMPVFFALFRGFNPLDTEKRRTLTSKAYLEYLKKSYTRQQLLGMQMFLRNEEFNEVANQIISDLLKQTDTKETKS
ncbi:MAG: CapA family protein [Ruminococcus sp.]|nr:CapA family protein [Ruminococcus sp.]